MTPALLLLALATGLLVRADGKGGDDWIARNANVFTCAAVFGLLMLAHTQNPIIAQNCAVAFVLFRIKGFRDGGLPDFIVRLIPNALRDKAIEPEHGWQNWSNMFIRTAFWCLPAFALLSYAANHNLHTAWLALPFAAVNASIYGAVHRSGPWALFRLDKHIYAENLSGIAFFLFVAAAIAPVATQLLVQAQEWGVMTPPAFSTSGV